MNIFASFPDAKTSAIVLDDSRVVKMTLETAQLLSQAVLLHGGDHPSLYGITHHNHPCAKWCRKNDQNFSWLVSHGFALADEYTRRFSRRHASRNVIKAASKFLELLPKADDLVFDFDSSGWTVGDVHANYRRCLVEKWKVDIRKPKWTTRPVPSFFSSAA